MLLLTQEDIDFMEEALSCRPLEYIKYDLILLSAALLILAAELPVQLICLTLKSQPDTAFLLYIEALQ